MSLRDRLNKPHSVLKREIFIKISQQELDEKVECSFYSCKERFLKSEMFECEWCYKLFCKTHKNPKRPMAFPGGRTNGNASDDMEEYHKQGHPCPPYALFIWKSEKK